MMTIKKRAKRLIDTAMNCCRGVTPEISDRAIPVTHFGDQGSDEQVITTIQCPKCKANIAGSNRAMAIICWNTKVKIK